MNILKPEFYDRFSCVGSACPLTCCGGWCITIDEKTRKKYRKMGGKIAKFAKKNINYSEEIKDNVVDLQESQGACPLLNEKQLCEVVLQKGVDALSNTCKIYPREQVASFDTQEKYLTLGCPQVVKLLFENKGKITFYLQEDAAIDMENIPVYNDLLLINLKVREMIADFLQREEFPFWFREFYGAYVLEKIQKQILEKDLTQVVLQLEHLLKPSFCLAMYDGIKENKNREQQFQSLCGSVNAFERIIRGALFDDLYGYSKVIEELLLRNRTCTFEEWNLAREKWRQKTNKYQRENVFVYNWMLGAFAPGKQDKLLQNYISCVLIDILANHLLILYEIEKEAQKETVEVIIAFLVRIFQHGNKRVKDIVREGIDEKILSPAFLIYLCNI